MLRDQERARQVDVEHAPPLGEVEFVREGAARDARGVDQAVDSAECRVDRLDRALYLLLVAHVGQLERSER